MNVIQNIAAVVGCISACIALLVTVCKPIRKKIVNWIADIADKPETSNAIKELRDQINAIQLQMKQESEENRKRHDELHAKIDSIKKAEAKSNDALKDIIRDRIVDTYYSNLQSKQLHYDEWENVSELANSYFALNGNSFVKGLMDQMQGWEIVQ